MSLWLFQRCIRPQLGLSRRHASTSTPVIFSRYLQQRRNQAQKSVLIQVSGPNSTPDVQSYLTSEFGPIEATFQYALPGNKPKQAGSSGALSSQGGQAHWVLAEFQNQADFEKAVQSCHNAVGTLPFVSSMCWFSQKVGGGKTSSAKGIPSVVTEKLSKSGDAIDFSHAKSLNEQILVLEKSLKITELGIRVRFLVADQLEQSVAKFFPAGCILPFGSTVSGIGRRSGDLDLVLVPDKSEIFPDLGVAAPSKNSRLWNQTKLYSNSSNSRFQVQRVMETVADMIQLFVPGCTQVQRILQARVPILRFWSEYTDLQCDLSMTNSSGIHMSELIYIMTALDSRFTSLLFAIRSWASARKITNPVPGRQPTNFILVLLLIYFCQFKKILPTYDILFNNAGKNDSRTTADGIDCTFLRDPAKILKFFTPQNQSSSLSELLYEFFEFYSEFDFTSKGVSLFTGSAWGKPDAGPMYIQNPIERHLNVARNVSKEEISRLKSECCAALWKLETLKTSQAIDVAKAKKSKKVSLPFTLQELLLAPQIQTISSGQTQSIKMKDLLVE